MEVELERVIICEDVEVSSADFPNKMTWDQAKKACKELGEGWRLPKKQELSELYNLQKQGVVEFEKDWYWAYEEYNTGNAWYFGFKYGNFFASYKINNFCVRAVRDIR